MEVFLSRTSLLYPLLFFSVGSVFAQQDDQISTLTVSGAGTVHVAPDEASVRLGITRQEPTAQAAQQEANLVANQILTAITALGIEQDRIQTSELRLTPVYAPQRPASREEPRIVAYRASNVVSVRLDELSRVGPVIDAGLESGANQLQGVSFGLRDDTKAREQALKEAVNEARSKANAIAEALNVRLLGVLQVNEGGISIRPVVVSEARLMSAADTATPVSPGQVTVNGSVSIRYRIGP